MENFLGYHSEWNLGSPGGWDYQRITQSIGKAVWQKLLTATGCDPGLDLDFDHPYLLPIDNFVEMLVQAHRDREGSNSGLIAVVAEEETLDSVVENANLAKRLDSVDGLSGGLMAPHELEVYRGRVCWKGRPVSILFVDFNTDVLLHLHREHDLTALLQAVSEGRVVNPRGTEPINSKAMFEVLTDSETSVNFDSETVSRTPWTRRFFPRRTVGPDGQEITDLIEWTRSNWDNLVLKPERGYSGKGVRVGGEHCDVDEIIQTALEEGSYIVQKKVPVGLWGELMPEFDTETQSLEIEQFQTDFRCLFGPAGVFGFLGRYGGIPTNVGSGGGVQPLAVLRSDIGVGEATARINDFLMNADPGLVLEALECQKQLAWEHEFTYLLGPIRLALRPRLLTESQMKSLDSYCSGIWRDCVTLEKMWLDGVLDSYVSMDEEELDIVRSQPWAESPAIFASDGLFSFGAHPRANRYRAEMNPRRG